MKDQQWTVIKVLKWTAEYFASRGIEHPRTDAEVLLAHVLGYERLDLYLNYDQPLVKSELEAYRNAIKRRLRREPVQYITGKQEFWSLPIKVTPAVLIPRPETECLVEKTLEVVKSIYGAEKSLRILELGTGSGAVAIALARELPHAIIFASDVSMEALSVAKTNVEEINTGTSIFLLASDLYGSLNPGLTNYFHVIVSNPPYVSRKEYDNLPPEIKEYEPKAALYGGEDGLSVIKDIITSGELYLAPGGYMLLEIGSSQGKQLGDFATSLSWTCEVTVSKDYSGLDRILILRKVPS